MGGSYYTSLSGSRILDTNRNDQSGVDDGNVTNWNKSNVFILAARFNGANKDSEPAQYKVLWRDITDSGSFADLDTTGECKFGDAVALSNGTALTSANSRCSVVESTYIDGEEIEGTKNSDSIDLGANEESEIQFAISAEDGDYEHEYGFEIWDSSNNRLVGVCGCTLTLAAEPGAFQSAWAKNSNQLIR